MHVGTSNIQLRWWSDQIHEVLLMIAACSLDWKTFTNNNHITETIWCQKAGYKQAILISVIFNKLSDFVCSAGIKCRWELQLQQIYEIMGVWVHSWQSG